MAYATTPTQSSVHLIKQYLKVQSNNIFEAFESSLGLINFDKMLSIVLNLIIILFLKHTENNKHAIMEQYYFSDLIKLFFHNQQPKNNRVYPKNI